MIFAKETLTAQWTGTNPIVTNADVGIGNTVFGAGATATMGTISNPLGQLHISQIRKVHLYLICTYRASV